MQTPANLSADNADIKVKVNFIDQDSSSGLNSLQLGNPDSDPKQ